MVRLKEIKDWLTPAEAGRVIGISKQAVINRLEEAKLRGVKTHQGWLVDPRDAERAARELRRRGRRRS
jgi:DNA-binding Lrp family transcriptional regulator